MISDALDLDDDRLPQPYRMIDQIVKGIIVAAWDVIEQQQNAPKKEYREQGASILKATDFQTLKLKAGGPTAIAVADSDIYAGTADGSIVRHSVLFDEVNLVSNTIFETDSDSPNPTPVSSISVNHVFIPITITTDGKEVKVVCFPLPPRGSSRRGSKQLSGRSSVDGSSLGGLDSPEPPEEKDRMLTLLHCTEESLGHAPVIAVETSSCGHFLAIVQKSAVTVYFLETLEFEVDTAIPELGEPLIIKPPMEVTSTKPSSSPPTKGKQPVPDEPDVKKDIITSELAPQLHWGCGGEGQPTSYLIVSWLGGYYATCENLPTGDKRVDSMMTDINEFIKNTDSERAPTTTGKEPQRKLSKAGKSAIPGTGVPSERRPGSQTRQPVTLHRGERRYYCTTQITASSLSPATSQPVLALGSVDGFINVFSLTTDTLMFSTCVHYRLSSRNPQSCFLKCLSISVWGLKYCASSWAWDTTDKNVDPEKVDTTTCDILIHSISGSESTDGSEHSANDAATVGTVNQSSPDSWLQPGTFVEVLMKSSWEQAVISSVGVGPNITVELMQSVRRSSDPQPINFIIDYTVSSGVPLNIRKLSLLATIKHVPLCYCLSFAPRAPVLFYVPLGSRLTVYDVLQLRIAAVIPLTDINPSGSVLGSGVCQGLPDSDGDASLCSVVLASVVYELCSSNAVEGDANEEPKKKSPIQSFRDIQSTQTLLASHWCVPFSDGLGVISRGADVNNYLFTMIPLPTILSHLFPSVGESLSACGDIEQVYSLLASGCYFRNLHDTEFVGKRLAIIPPRGSLASNTVKTKPSAKSRTTTGTQRVGFGNTEADTLVTFEDEAFLGPGVGVNFRCAAFLERGRRERGARKDQVTALLANIHKQYCG